METGGTNVGYRHHSVCLGLVAGIYGFGLFQARVIGPARPVFYVLLLLAIAILAVDINQRQEAELNPVIQPVVE